MYKRAPKNVTSIVRARAAGHCTRFSYIVRVRSTVRIILYAMEFTSVVLHRKRLRNNKGLRAVGLTPGNCETDVLRPPRDHTRVRIYYNIVYFMRPVALSISD